MSDFLMMLAGFLIGIAAGAVAQAWRTARKTGTSTREQIMLAGGPDPVRPK